MPTASYSLLLVPAVLVASASKYPATHCTAIAVYRKMPGHGLVAVYYFALHYNVYPCGHLAVYCSRLCYASETMGRHVTHYGRGRL